MNEIKPGDTIELVNGNTYIVTDIWIEPDLITMWTKNDIFRHYMEFDNQGRSMLWSVEFGKPETRKRWLNPERDYDIVHGL